MYLCSCVIGLVGKNLRDARLRGKIGRQELKRIVLVIGSLKIGPIAPHMQGRPGVSVTHN